MSDNDRTTLLNEIKSRIESDDDFTDLLDEADGKPTENWCKDDPYYAICFSSSNALIESVLRRKDTLSAQRLIPMEHVFVPFFEYVLENNPQKLDVCIRISQKMGYTMLLFCLCYYEQRLKENGQPIPWKIIFALFRQTDVSTMTNWMRLFDYPAMKYLESLLNGDV